MDFKHQGSEIQILNYPQLQDTFIQKHGRLLPNNIRAIVCGSPGCGKTNVVISLIIDPNGLKFQNVYVYSKTLRQRKYEFLKSVFDNLKNMEFFSFNNNEEVIEPENILPDSVLVLDDISQESQTIIKKFFSTSRHDRVDIFYLCHSHALLLKHQIRNNTNFLVVFPIDTLNLKHIFDDHVNGDMNFANFQRLCKMCLSDKYSFLVIDKESNINDGKYRKTFNSFVNMSF